jgi:hypothetical protein
MLGEMGVLVGEKKSECKCSCWCCPPSLGGFEGIRRGLSGMVRGGRVACGGRGGRERSE